MKRRMLCAITVFVLGLAALSAAGAGLSFEQVSWLDTSGGYVSQYSDWGQVLVSLNSADDGMFYDMTLLDGTVGRGGYVNIVTDAGGSQSWEVANLPIFYQAPAELDGRLPQEVKFDLGVTSGGQVTALNYHYTIDQFPLAAMPGTGTGGSASVVEFSQFMAGDNLWMGSTFIEGAGGGTPQPAEDFGGAGAGEALGWQTGIAVPQNSVPAIDEDGNGCAPGAVARSIQYMDSAHDNVNLPDYVTPQATYDLLYIAMDTKPNGTSTADILTGKDAFVDVLGLPIVSTQTTNFFTAMQTLANKGDVELGVNWGTGANGKSQGAHRTFVSGIQEIVDGSGNTTGFVVTTIDDPTQGDGNAENRQHTMKFDANGKLVQCDGHGVAADAGIINFQIENVIPVKEIIQWWADGGFYILPAGGGIPRPGGNIPLGRPGRLDSDSCVGIRYDGAHASGGGHLISSHLLVNPPDNGTPQPDRTDSLVMVLDGEVAWVDPSAPIFVGASLHLEHLLPEGEAGIGPYGAFVAAVEGDETIMLENLVATSSFFDITYAVDMPGTATQLFRLHGEIPEELLGKAWLLSMDNTDPDWWVESFFDVFFEMELSPDAYELVHMVESPLLNMEFFALLVPGPGDLDKDGDVDNADIGLAAGNFTGAGGTGMTWEDGDMDRDGDVDNADIGLIAGAFTGAMSSGGQSPPVPEPASLSLLALGGLATLRRRRS